MEGKFTEATIQRSQRKRTIDTSLFNIDLPSYIEQIRNDKPWNERDRNAMTVFKTNGMRIVLIALDKGAEMIKHKADGLISIEVLEGQMLLNTDEQSVELGKGQMLALHTAIPHCLLAKEETFFLLTLTTTLVENNTGIQATLVWNNIL